MKLNLFYKKIFLKLLIIIIFIFSIESLAKNNFEKEIKNVTSKLRCMTCQNQTIYSSDTDFSKNIKKIIKEKLIEDQTEKEIIDFLIYRYGEYIAFEPQMSKQNIFLWFFPFIILAISLVFLTLAIKKKH